jgi:GNAT superfamily N-acetyltransferase
MTWSGQQVLAASDSWRWVPPEATTFEVAGVQVIDYPEWAFTGCYVTPLDTGLASGNVAGLIREVARTAGERGKTAITWWISPSTRPGDIGAALENAGAQLTETCDIYAFDMTAGLPSVGRTEDVRTTLVNDERALDDFALVGDAVWGRPAPISAQRRAEQLADFSRPVAERDGCRIVAYVDGEPVGIGGMQLVDGVARLWGAATLENARSRGVYRAVLGHRLAIARDAGATLALVHARIGTSGPIVRRCGFTSHGRGYSYDLPIDSR